jgi:hypothetical protein
VLAGFINLILCNTVFPAFIITLSHGKNSCTQPRSFPSTIIAMFHSCILQHSVSMVKLAIMQHCGGVDAIVVVKLVVALEFASAVLRTERKSKKDIVKS